RGSEAGNPARKRLQVRRKEAREERKTSGRGAARGNPGVCPPANDTRRWRRASADALPARREETVHAVAMRQQSKKTGRVALRVGRVDAGALPRQESPSRLADELRVRRLETLGLLLVLLGQ